MAMKLRQTERDGAEAGGFGGFLKSLFSGVPWSESAVREESLLCGAPPSHALSLHNANGGTRIIGEDREDVQIDVRKHARAESQDAAEELLDAIKIETMLIGGVLEVDVQIPKKWNRHGYADLQVRLPRALEIRASSSNGKLCLRGLRSGAWARSSNGSVRIDDVHGNIDVTTANAKVSCACTCGHLVARSSNGKIELAEHSGSVDAVTSNGLIRASLDELGEEGISLATSNGRIVIELPKEPDAEIDIRVDNGLIRSELELGRQVEEGSGRLRGTLGRGGCPIKLRTSNGTICLR